MLFVNGNYYLEYSQLGTKELKTMTKIIPESDSRLYSVLFQGSWSFGRIKKRYSKILPWIVMTLSQYCVCIFCWSVSPPQWCVCVCVCVCLCVSDCEQVGPADCLAQLDCWHKISQRRWTLFELPTDCNLPLHQSSTPRPDQCLVWLELGKTLSFVNIFDLGQEVRGNRFLCLQCWHCSPSEAK